MHDDLVKKNRKFNPNLKEKYSRAEDRREKPKAAAKEEEAAREAMTHFVTNPEGSIYAMMPMVPELFSALLKARYSRTELSAKQLLWREFVAQKNNIPWKQILKGREMLDEVLNFKRAESVAERILLQYGDDSVFELGGAHLFTDRVSQVAAKVIEDIRIGLSPLEKSTRYVVFDQKNNDGDYSFYKEPRIMESPFKDLYLDATRHCFDVYAKAVAIFLDFFKKQVPLEEQKFPDFTQENKPTLFGELKDEKSIKAAQIAYNASIRAKACDVARVLLPASSLTNIGLFGNGRAYGYMATKMLAHPLIEMQAIAAESTEELKKVLPKFLDVVDNDHGQKYQEYLKKTEAEMQRWAKKLLKGIKPVKVDRVELVELDKDPQTNIAAALLYPYSNLPLQQLIKVVKRSGKKTVEQILKDSLKHRTNRRHKPPRAFEIAGYELVFDILGNFGIYRDIQRSRMLTQQHQNYTTEHGFDMPLEFGEVGLTKEFESAMAKMIKAHDKVVKKFPDEAQYLTTLSNYTRWYMGMNLREGFWLTELRSVPQGHFSYRTVAQDMFIKAQKRYPILKKLKPMNQHHVDMSDRSKNLERMEAMQRIEAKLAALES